MANIPSLSGIKWPNTLAGKDDLTKFGELAKLKHVQQFVWCLNALWAKGAEKDAEKWWTWYHKFVELDLKAKDEGCDLDELNAHRFYEAFNNTHTVKELRDKLREIGWEKRPMMFPFAVFATLEYKADWHYIVNAPQGDNSEEIAKAQKLLDEAIAALNAAAAAADAAAAAAQAAAQAAADAKRKAEESAVRESELKAAQAEVEAALNEVKAQEEARERKTKDLTEKSQGTGVKAGMAKQELAQHLGADPLPLRKAKITLEAANRKAQKAADAATAAREAAEAAAVEAAKKAKEAAAKQKEAEAKKAEAEEKVAEAQAKLDEIKAQPGQALGLIWWMERHLKYVQSFGRRK